MRIVDQTVDFSGPRFFEDVVEVVQTIPRRCVLERIVELLIVVPVRRFGKNRPGDLCSFEAFLEAKGLLFVCKDRRGGPELSRLTLGADFAVLGMLMASSWSECLGVGIFSRDGGFETLRCVETRETPRRNALKTQRRYKGLRATLTTCILLLSSLEEVSVNFWQFECRARDGHRS